MSVQEVDRLLQNPALERLWIGMGHDVKTAERGLQTVSLIIQGGDENNGAS